MSEQTTIHATCVSFKKRGVLLRGKSGIGKSDLALRLIEVGGILVSDDQVVITKKEGRLVASPPKKLKGMLEVRGVGICHFPFLTECNLYVVVELGHDILPERLPDLELQEQTILKLNIAGFLLDPFEGSAAAKVQAMLQLVQ